METLRGYCPSPTSLFAQVGKRSGHCVHVHMFTGNRVDKVLAGHHNRSATKRITEGMCYKIFFTSIFIHQMTSNYPESSLETVLKMSIICNLHSLPNNKTVANIALNLQRYLNPKTILHCCLLRGSDFFLPAKAEFGQN